MRRAVLFALGALAVLAVSACTRDAAPTSPTSQLTGPPPPKTIAANKDDVTLFFAGDTSVARGVADTIDGPGRGDPAWVFEHTRELFAKADLTFLNLECVLADSDAGEAKKTWRIRAPVKYAAGLKTLGVDVVSVANNHALDFAEPGFRSTLQELDKLGILATGVQYTEPPTQAPTIVQVGQLKVGFLAYNAHGDEHKDIEYRPRSFGYRRAAVLADIKRARPTVDVLAVSIHWGPELAHWPWDWQVQDAHAYVDAGADFILGHHPHVVQPWEQYKNALIVYSFGDFIFDKSSPWLVDRTNARYGLRVSYSKKTRTGFEIVPMWPDRDRRPVVRPDIDTSSWQMKAAPPVAWRASESLERAVVTRAKLAVEACGWNKTRPIVRSGYLRWLAPRLACHDDEKRPWMTVAPTAEFASGTLRRGIWAPPHDPEAPLRLVFPAVPLSTQLTGFVGVPDWWARQPMARPVRLSVSIAGDAAPRLQAEVQAGVAPWRDIVVDTADRQGTTADVIVEVVGGAAPKEGSFVFDLETAR